MIGDPLPHDPPLTRAEVDTLPDATPIIVMWSGGNGPHNYILRDIGRGWRCAQSEQEATIDLLDFDGKSLGIDAFIGQEPMHTRVWGRG